MVKRNAKSPTHHWNVSGLLIGNGWISGPDQYISYIPFAYETGVLTAGSDAARVAENQERKCLDLLQKPDAADHVDISTCEAIMQEILRTTQRSSHDDACVNMYDVRLRDSYPSCGMNWPPDLEYVKPYLRRDDVKKALHVNADKKTGWVECNNQVGSAFTAKNSKPSVRLLPSLLEQMPVLLFNGDQDMICNHIGTENLINNLNFNGGTGMQISTGMTAAKQDWTFEGEPAGQYQTARNLTYLRFYNSSHMVPFDYPRRSRDMLDRFMGVDIGSIGGDPQDSRIDGEKGIETSVGGHPNSTAAKEKDAEAVQAAAWAAYRRSGEVALVFVIIAAVAGAIVIVRQRSRRKGYKGVLGADPYEDGRGLGLDGASRKVERDVEAARDFDEAELDDLEPGSGKRREGGLESEPFGLEDDEDDEDEHPRTNGHARG
jgi:carboxypeptidase D